MPRSRSLKPGFFKNDLLAETGPLGMLLFEGLWTIADRAGRLEDRPLRIKAEVLPYFDASVDDLLCRLAERGFVERYAVNGTRYIQVINFCKHQTPHIKEPASEIPPPGGYAAPPTEAPDKHGASTGQAPDSHPLNPSDSGLLTPDSGLLTAEGGSGGDSTEEEDDAHDEYSAEFEAFWSVYPKHKSKGAAWNAWKKRNPSKSLQQRMFAAVARLSLSAEWNRDNGQFIPYPATWINAGGWDDEPDALMNGAAPSMDHDDYQGESYLRTAGERRKPATGEG